MSKKLIISETVDEVPKTVIISITMLFLCEKLTIAESSTDLKVGQLLSTSSNLNPLFTIFSVASNILVSPGVIPYKSKSPANNGDNNNKTGNKKIFFISTKDG